MHNQSTLSQNVQGCHAHLCRFLAQPLRCYLLKSSYDAKICLHQRILIRSSYECSIMGPFRVPLQLLPKFMHISSFEVQNRKIGFVLLQGVLNFPYMYAHEITVGSCCFKRYFVSKAGRDPCSSGVKQWVGR